MFLNIKIFLYFKIQKTTRRITNKTEIIDAAFNPGIEYLNEIWCSPEETLIPRRASDILIIFSSLTASPSINIFQPSSYGIDVNKISFSSATNVPSILVSLNFVYSI